MPSPIDISGKKFGRLVAVRMLPRKGKQGQRLWKCVCDCGAIRIVVQGWLTTGNTKSCGGHRGSHYASDTSAYFTWRSMRSRCQNPDIRAFRWYGARGIRVCRRWQKFENFLEDMGNPPKGMSLERIDNRKGYSKENCKWASKLEQTSNMRSNHFLTFRGRTMHASGWARFLGIKIPTVFSRLKAGWPIKRVLQVENG